MSDSFLGANKLDIAGLSTPSKLTFAFQISQLLRLRISQLCPIRYALNGQRLRMSEADLSDAEKAVQRVGTSSTPLLRQRNLKRQVLSITSMTVFLTKTDGLTLKGFQRES